eukprot:scaffold62912_cov65-Phaeocystis_antarctica.AAC.7
MSTPAAASELLGRPNAQRWLSAANGSSGSGLRLRFRHSDPLNRQKDMQARGGATPLPQLSLRALAARVVGRGRQHRQRSGADRKTQRLLRNRRHSQRDPARVGGAFLGSGSILGLGSRVRVGAGARVRVRDRVTSEVEEVADEVRLVVHGAGAVRIEALLPANAGALASQHCASHALVRDQPGLRVRPCAARQEPSVGCKLKLRSREEGERAGGHLGLLLAAYAFAREGAVAVAEARARARSRARFGAHGVVERLTAAVAAALRCAPVEVTHALADGRPGLPPLPEGVAHAVWRRQPVLRVQRRGQRGETRRAAILQGEGSSAGTFATRFK